MKNSIKHRSVVLFSGSLLFIACMGAAHADRLSDIKARGTLICGVLGTVPPFGFQHPTTRTTVGYDVEMCNIVAKHLGVKTELKVMAPPARIPEIDQGRVDMVAGALGWTPARAEQVDYSYGYYQTPSVLGFPASAGYTSWADLHGKRIGAGNATTSAAAVKDKIPEAKLVTFEDVSQVLLALRQGKVEAIALNEPILRQYMQKVAGTPDAAALITEPPLLVETFGIGIKKGEKALLDEINAALIQADKDGTLDQAFDEYLGTGTEYGMTRKFKVEPIGG